MDFARYWGVVEGFEYWKEVERVIYSPQNSILLFPLSTVHFNKASSMSWWWELLSWQLSERSVCGFMCRSLKNEYCKLERSKTEQNTSLLFSGLKPRDISHSSYIFPSRPFTNFVALLWTKLNKTLEVRPHRTEQSRTVPSVTWSSTGHAASQDTFGPFGCQGKLLAQTELAINQNPKMPFHRTALQPLLL